MPATTGNTKQNPCLFILHFGISLDIRTFNFTDDRHGSCLENVTTNCGTDVQTSKFLFNGRTSFLFGHSFVKKITFPQTFRLFKKSARTYFHFFIGRLAAVTNRQVFKSFARSFARFSRTNFRDGIRFCFSFSKLISRALTFCGRWTNVFAWTSQD